MPPDISQVEEVIDAPIGSIYIDEVENVVYVKGEASWEIIIKKIESLNYISSSSIAIIKEGEDNKIQVIAGPGIKVTKLGVSANVDSANLSIDSAGKLTAKSDKHYGMQRNYKVKN